MKIAIDEHSLFTLKYGFMKNASFSRLTIPQQAEILLEEGLFLHTREEPGFFVDLYELHGQFIELYFHKKHEDFVIVKSFYSSEANQLEVAEEANTLYALPFSWQGILC